MLDHIIVSENRYFSFQEEHLLPDYLQQAEIVADQNFSFGEIEKNTKR